MVCPPFAALQKVFAKKEGLVKPVSAKPTVIVPAHAKVTFSVQPTTIEPLFPSPVAPNKPRIKAVQVRTGSVKLSVGDTAPAPAPDGPGTTTTAKPTVKVRSNGNGRKRPKLTVKKE